MLIQNAFNDLASCSLVILNLLMWYVRQNLPIMFHITIRSLVRNVG